MLKIIEQKVREHPFKDVDDLHVFIDKLFDKLVNGRTTETTKLAKAHRASI
jgi:hypothetical protein